MKNTHRPHSPILTFNTRKYSVKNGYSQGVFITRSLSNGHATGRGLMHETAGVRTSRASFSLSLEDLGHLVLVSGLLDLNH